MQSDGRSDSPLSGWVAQLSGDFTASPHCIEPASVPPPASRLLDKGSGFFQLIKDGWLHLETDLSHRVDQSGIDHHLHTIVAQEYIDEVATIGGRLPTNLRHSLARSSKAINYLEHRISVSRE